MKPLTIALDLTCVPAQLGGVGRYLVHLVDGLQRARTNETFLLLLPESRASLFHVSAPYMSVVHLADRSRPRRLLWEQTGLVQTVSRLGVDVLHSPHYTRPLRRLPCASVVGVMDMTFFLLPERHTAMKRRFFRFMIPRSVARADRVLAISESTKRDVCTHLAVDPSKIDVTPLAAGSQYRADLSSDTIVRVKERLQLPESYILCVGTLEPRKNVSRLLAAYERLARDGVVPALVLVGARGWHTNALDRRLASARARGTVLELGYVAECDLPAVYAGASLFVYPSLYEGFGIPVAEALASGVAVITSNVSSMPEVAGDAAILVDPSSEHDIAEAIRRVLDDERLRSELRLRGLARSRDLSWSHTAASTIACYRRAFASWGRR